ncbi:hypothetical protein HID58_068321 [Brassica napus]|uniref:Replication protein A 70 kDa DNA-binding subunit B/D first OB fold domain-containing protein n=1 Tax=Brassica napus TaxID=3708 RepID=A0ABQ7ZLL2_BRANA|nr:hypothetical protein HID58_068321 [Brassica napus]
MASFSNVTDLKPFKTMWKIRVRIIRLWKQYSAAGGLTIEMVVVDCNSCGSYRTTNHQYTISFLETTRVRDCDFPAEVSGFDPANYRDILDGRE